MPDDAFDEFWRAYPRRVAKGEARKAWQKLHPSPELVARMLTALSWQVTQPAWTKDGGKFIPHPSTWLNQQRWDDEPFEPRPTAAKMYTWHAECDALHAGRCGNAWMHDAVMHKDDQ